VPALGTDLDLAADDDVAAIGLPPADDDEEFLDVGIDFEAVAPIHAQSSDEDLLDVDLDAPDSLFDDGEDAPELTEPEPSALDGATPDTSLFETPGTDLATPARGAPKKKA
jgi:hypothetical protein